MQLNVEDHDTGSVVVSLITVTFEVAVAFEG
jgi:hypothetical protein